MSHRYSTEKAEAFVLEGIIIENIVKEGATLTPPDVRDIKDMNLRLCEDRNYALLVDPREGSTITDEARTLLASRELATFNIAKAILIYTKKQKIIGNIYLSINKPHVRTRLFTDREKALDWLREEVANYSARELMAGRK